MTVLVPLLCAVLLAAPVAPAPPGMTPPANAPGPAPMPPPPLTIIALPQLAPALARENGKRKQDVLWLRLQQRDLDPQSAKALVAWVIDGGTLWTETDAAALFGFQCTRPAPAELYGHARRACGVLASSLVAQVDDVYYHLDPTDVFVTGHDTALALLKVADATVRPTGVKLVAAELPYGDGLVIHRPSEVHPDRGQGKAFESNLRQFSAPRPEDPVVPVDQLVVAQQHAAEAVAALPRLPEVKQKLLGVFCAYRLWYTNQLMRAGKLDEALTQLKAITADLPDDAAVYEAVARFNDLNGAPTVAEEARKRAADLYTKADRKPPRPDSRRLRVAWPTFVEAINAVGAAWDKPSDTGAAAVLARTDHLLALDDYRRGDLVTAAKRWTEANQNLPTYALPDWWLGLTFENFGDELRLAGRDRASWYGTAARWFDIAAKAPTSSEFEAGNVVAAKAWRDVAGAAATRAAADPPDVLVDNQCIIRFDARDVRLRVGPRLTQFQQALDEAWRDAATSGVYLEPPELLVATDDVAMRGMLPTVGLVRQAFGTSACAGRRIYTVVEPTDAVRQLRHEFFHVMINALTEGGFPPPLWYEEGLAGGSEQSIYQRQTALSDIRGGKVMNIAQMNDANVMFNRDVMDHAFGQAELMVDALLKRFGQNAVVPFLMNLGWGTSPDQAFTQLTGLTQEQYLTAFLTGRL